MKIEEVVKSIFDSILSVKGEVENAGILE